MILAWFVATLVGNALTYAGMLAQFALLAQDEVALGWTVYTVGLVLGMLVSVWMHMGFVRYLLKLARGQVPAFGEIFAGGPLLALLGASLLLGIGVSIGYLLLIVPGVILAAGWLLVPYLVIERRAAVLDAFGTSWRATNGHKVSLVLLALLILLVSMAGMLAFCVGVLVAIPVCMLAIVYAYLKLTGEEPVLPPKFA